MKIKEMDIGGYEQVISLWKESEGIGLSDADSRDNIAKYLARNPGFSFVAEDGGRVVGAVLCGHDGRRGYLHHLAVQPEYRRNGIGRTLVDKALDKLKMIGIGKCHLFIFNDNESGMDFWESQDWKLRNDLEIMSKIIG